MSRWKWFPNSTDRIPARGALPKGTRVVRELAWNGGARKALDSRSGSCFPTVRAKAVESGDDMTLSPEGPIFEWVAFISSCRGFR